MLVVRQLLRKNYKRFAAMLGVLVILALLAVPAFADNSATPTVTTDDEGNIISVPVYIWITAGASYNGHEYAQGELVFIGNYAIGEMISLSSVVRDSYHVVSYTFQARYLNVVLDDIYYLSGSSVVVNGSWYRLMDQAVVNGSYLSSGMRLVIFPEWDVDSDDEYHSAALIRVINALWQNFYSSFIELTSSMNFFGISILSVLGILVTVFVVVTIVKIFHGGS